ncbi:MAG: type I glyceraldehyde-3-phosphate dehydrogenase [Patescibacteria group bacterium]|nr:type I glyceraldehyde-3-phosphate dehydrogenase [Patescibacteria group bacterium]
MIKVAINGFGRIGRQFFQIAFERQNEIEIVGINDLGDLENLAYLLQYDTVYGKYDKKVEVVDGNIVVEGKKIKFSQEKDPSNLPWKELNVDVCVECTGVFTEKEKAKMHLDAGAKRVVISAPAKGGVPTILLGVNEDKMKDDVITSNASCTTNAITPVVAVLNEKLGIEKAILNTTHAYTATQSLVDGPAEKKDMRRGRAAAMNLVPSTTGAAKATCEAITTLAGKFDGVAVRIPVVCGSIADVTFISKKETTVEEVNGILKDASKEERWKKLLEVTEDQIVSSDIVGNSHASIVDSGLTMVVGGNLVKVMAWYDNEWGYAQTLVDHVVKSGLLIEQ